MLAKTGRHPLLGVGVLVGILGLFITRTPAQASAAESGGGTTCSHFTDYTNGEFAQHSHVDDCCLPNVGCCTFPTGDELAGQKYAYTCTAAPGHSGC